MIHVRLHLRCEDDAEADRVTLDIGADFLADSRAGTGGAILPTAATHYDSIACDARFGVNQLAAGQATVIPIERPLPDVAVHIIQPIGIRLVAPYGRGAIPARGRAEAVLTTLWIDTAEVPYRGVGLISEIKRCGGLRSGCILPLDLSRQAIDIAFGKAPGCTLEASQDLAEILRLRPEDALDRTVGVFKLCRILPHKLAKLRLSHLIDARPETVG